MPKFSFSVSLQLSPQLWNIRASRWGHRCCSIHPQNPGEVLSTLLFWISLFFNQPGTRGKYTLIIDPGPGLAVCKVCSLSYPFCSFERKTVFLSNYISFPLHLITKCDLSWRWWASGRTWRARDFQPASLTSELSAFLSHGSPLHGHRSHPSFAGPSWSRSGTRCGSRPGPRPTSPWTPLPILAQSSFKNVIDS